MAKETKNLKLHQVTRPEDDSKAFNLETMLNENWEKLDSAVGDLSQPVTTAEGAAIGLRVQNGRLQYKNNESWTELGLEYEDVKNLAARSDGLVTWALPQSTDNTRTAIVLCRASKDISNMDYAACLADASITKNTLAQNATSNTYTGLTNSTQYWVKAFVKYTLGGKEFYSGGVTVTFTTPAIKITEFYNAGNEFTAVTGGWVAGFNYNSFVHEKKSDNLYIRANGTQSNISMSTFVTDVPINLTNLKTLNVEFTSERFKIGTIVFSIGKNKDSRGDWDSSKVVTGGMFTNRTTLTLDVSAITGDWYIKESVSSAETDNFYEAKIYRVWGES